MQRLCSMPQFKLWVIPRMQVKSFIMNSQSAFEHGELVPQLHLNLTGRVASLIDAEGCCFEKMS